MSTDTFEFDQSKSIESTGSKFASKPGKYHVMIIQALANPPKKDGTPIMDCLQVETEIVAGTNPTEVGKSFNLRLWKGKPEDKQAGLAGDEKAESRYQMACRKFSRLLVAQGGVHNEGPTILTLTPMVGRQIVLELSMRPDSNGKEQLDLHYDNIYHVDDDKVKDVPKNQEYLSLIPKHFRRDPSLLANAVAGAVTGSVPSGTVPAGAKAVATGALADC